MGKNTDTCRTDTVFPRSIASKTKKLNDRGHAFHAATAVRLIFLRSPVEENRRTNRLNELAAAPLWSLWEELQYRKTLVEEELVDIAMLQHTIVRPKCEFAKYFVFL